MQEGRVAVRERLKGDIGAMSLDEFRELAQRLIKTRALMNDSA
jgi:threonyl-tRNA synthetase